MSLTPDEQKEYWASLALRHTQGLGPRSWKRLLAAYHSAYAAFKDARHWAGQGLTRPAVAQAVINEAWRTSAQAEWEAVRDLGCGVLLYTSMHYPQQLREIPDPPLYLYAQGDASLLRTPGVGVVGTRQSTRYGRDTTRELCSALSKWGVTIISGLAYGIDRQAHISGLDGLGSSIAVLGAGLDSVYPAGNADVRARLNRKGLVLTEYAPGVRPEPRNFPVRNRIISGLSLGIIVVEASEKSGSIITAKQAIEQGREVFAVPGPRGSSNHTGCFWLINQGAKLICNARDVLRELEPQLKHWCRNENTALFTERREMLEQAPLRREKPQQAASPAPPAIPEGLNEEEHALFVILRPQNLHIDDLGRRLDWDSGRVSRVLLLLEMRGVVRQLPGMIYGIV